MSITNFDIPDDLKLKFKIKAAQDRKSMTEILITFIKSYVDWDKKERAA